MADSKGPSSIRNMMYSGKNSLLPPKSPFPSISPSYAEYIPSSAIGPKSLAKPREGNSNHQRTSSEGFLMEEQPSWLDELLDEPETPVRRGHRRSSSDSFAYIDSSNVGSMNYMAQESYKYKNVKQAPSWGSQDFDIYRDTPHSSLYMDLNHSVGTKNRPWDTPVSSVAPPRGIPSSMVTIVPNAGQDGARNSSSSTEKKDLGESRPQDRKGSIEKKDFSHAKSSETETKRAKQQYAQRSRVRKLQYIAELERNVQALQAEGAEVVAELEFFNQERLILSMENKSLKKRLANLAQEQLIKHVEHEVLDRELARLRSLFQHQQQPQQQQQQQQKPQQQQQKPEQQQISSSLRRVNSRDQLDEQFANLSLKHKESSSGSDSFSGQLHM